MKKLYIFLILIVAAVLLRISIIYSIVREPVFEAETDIKSENYVPEVEDEQFCIITNKKNNAVVYHGLNKEIIFKDNIDFFADVLSIMENPLYSEFTLDRAYTGFYIPAHEYDSLKLVNEIENDYNVYKIYNLPDNYAQYISNTYISFSNFNSLSRRSEKIKWYAKLFFSVDATTAATSKKEINFSASLSRTPMSSEELSADGAEFLDNAKYDTSCIQNFDGGALSFTGVKNLDNPISIKYNGLDEEYVQKNVMVSSYNDALDLNAFKELINKLP